MRADGAVTKPDELTPGLLYAEIIGQAGTRNRLKRVWSKPPDQVIKNNLRSALGR